MSKRGGEEAELHQMKWGESNSSINQARAKGRVYCVFYPLSRCGTERQGVNEAAYSGQQRSTTGSQRQTMSDSNTIAASTTDQVSPNSSYCVSSSCVCLFCFFATPVLSRAGSGSRLLLAPHSSGSILWEVSKVKLCGMPKTEPSFGYAYIIFRS